MAARTVLFLAGSLVTMAAGLILARRLDPTSYAAVQSLTKRMIQYVAAVTMAAEIWVIRDALLPGQGLKRSISLLTIISSLVGGGSGLVLVWAITRDPLASVLAASAGVLVGIRGALGLVVEVRRPVRLPLIVAGGRFIYAGLVALLVQLLRRGLLGALTSFLARSAFVAAFIAYYFARSPPQPSTGREREERVLQARARATVPRALFSLAPNLDVPLVLALTGSPLLISGFFVARLVPFTLVEVMRNTFRYLQASYRRSSWTDRDVALSVRMSIALVIPILAYVAVYPDHVICLINCKYLWASPMARLFGVEALLLLSAIALENAYLGRLNTVTRSGKEHAAMVERFYTRLLAAPAVYLLILGVALPRLHGGLQYQSTAWAAAVLAMSVIHLTVTSIHWGPQSVRLVLAPLAGLLAFSIMAAATLPIAPATPSPRFFEQLAAVAPGAILFYLLVETAYFALDPWARRTLASTTRAAARRIRG